MDKKQKLKPLKIEYLEKLTRIFMGLKKKYKLVRVNNFWSNNYIEYECNGDRNKALFVEDYLNKISSYLKDIINNTRKCDTCTIQLTIANTFYIFNLFYR